MSDLMDRLTLRQAQVVFAFTGRAACSVEDLIPYAEEVLGRTVTPNEIHDSRVGCNDRCSISGCTMLRLEGRARDDWLALTVPPAGLVDTPPAPTNPVVVAEDYVSDATIDHWETLEVTIERVQQAVGPATGRRNEPEEGI